MTCIARGTLAFVTLLMGVNSGAAESLPPLFHNLSATPENSQADHTLAKRLQKAYPSDIRSSTLQALFELEGFDIESKDERVEATIVEAKYPCMTRYVITWEETESGRIDDLRAEMDQKCV